MVAKWHLRLSERFSLNWNNVYYSMLSTRSSPVPSGGNNNVVEEVGTTALRHWDNKEKNWKGRDKSTKTRGKINSSKKIQKPWEGKSIKKLHQKWVMVNMSLPISYFCHFGHFTFTFCRYKIEPLVRGCFLSTFHKSEPEVGHFSHTLKIH